MTSLAPKRVCFLGNSHIASVRSAYTPDPDRWPSLEAHFVGAHKGILLETEVIDGVLTPVTPEAQDVFQRLGGGAGVDLAAYDAFVVTGCLIAMPIALAQHRALHWSDLPSVAAHADLAQNPALLVSRTVALATLVDTLDDRLGAQVVARLTQHTQRPVYLTAQPRVSAALKQINDPKTFAHRKALRLGDQAHVAALFEDAANLAISKAGGRYIPQPAQTIDDHIMTDPAYMQGAKRLTADGRAPQPDTDIRHANAAYGALVLDQIAAQLA